MFDDPEINERIEYEALLRLDTLIEVFNILVEKKFFSNLFLNKDVLYSALISQLIDLERASAFHDFNFADDHKKAAFTLKWIMKIRPIMIDKEVTSKDLSSKEILANEIFALLAGLSIIKIDINNISEKYLGNLIYILRYRELEGLVLSSQMYLLECSIKGITP